MTTIAQIRTDVDALPLGKLLRLVPTTTIELERIVPVHPHIIPYFWTHGVAAAEIEAVFDGSHGTHIEPVESVGDDTLFKVEWRSDELSDIVHVFVDGSIELLAATGTKEGWEFEIRGPSHESVGGFITHLEAEGVSVNLTRLYKMVRVEDLEFGLTDPQREALVLAYERGYYDSPRRSTLETIGTELDITRQSLSSRLRRGTKNVLEHTVVNE